MTQSASDALPLTQDEDGNVISNPNAERLGITEAEIEQYVKANQPTPVALETGAPPAQQGKDGFSSTRIILKQAKTQPASHAAVISKAKPDPIGDLMTSLELFPALNVFLIVATVLLILFAAPMLKERWAKK